ncbi:fibrillin-2-like [Anneissia japonica]|uniref:fibrillin-2-like n=1 Tax=Anneissia japonica TaxID=1529436 RepID=UPI001425B22C|nr:fibrillin-2-like [Anneissia japonica]
MAIQVNHRQEIKTYGPSEVTPSTIPCRSDMGLDVYKRQPYTCNDGYSGNGYMCLDINECSTSPCSDMATCTNFAGGYACQCDSGFEGDGVTCSDIVECDDSEICGKNSNCANTIGAYQCNCQAGYRSSGVLGCDNIDECAEGSDNCSPHANCNDTQGGFTCECTKGHNGDGVTCTDVNECMVENDCDENAMCSNTDGSYVCLCNEGYFNEAGGSATIGKCKNIDECSLNTDECSKDAVCTDVQGNYTCHCKSGYSGNGYVCNDIDECSISIPCPDEENKICDNTIGGYECVCAPNFVMFNNQCLAAVSRSLIANFTDIKGTSVSFAPDILDSVTTRNALADDVLNLLNSTAIWKYIQDVSVDRYAISGDLMQVTFRVDLSVNSNLTMDEVVNAFMDGLVDDLLPPDSVVSAQKVMVTTPVVDPCNEGTHDCFANNFTRCLFVSDGSFSCADCNSGFQQSADVCIDTMPTELSTSMLPTTEDTMSTELSTSILPTTEVVISTVLSTSMFPTTEDIRSTKASTTILSTTEGIQKKLFLVVFTILSNGGNDAAFDERLQDPNSALFEEYETLACEAVENSIANNDIANDLRSCRALRFENGSIVVYLEIGLQSETAFGSEDLLMAMTEGLENTGTLTIYSDSLATKDVYKRQIQKKLFLVVFTILSNGGNDAAFDERLQDPNSALFEEYETLACEAVRQFA